MSVPEIYTAVLAGVAAVGFIILRLRRANRTLRDALDRDRAADTPTQPAPPPPAPDNWPGTHLADLDECQLILAHTNDLEAGCARLWDAITEHRKEEDR